MFWKIIRWGGTLVLVLVAVAAFVSSNNSSTQAPASHGEQGLRIR